MELERIYASRRQSIAEALTEVLKQINGTGEYLSNLNNNVIPRFKFWDQVEEFPAVHVSTGPESRVYQAGGYKDRYLAVTVRCYVNEEDAAKALDKILEDIETVLEQNSRLEYYDKRGTLQCAHQITILSIDTDEGVLEPLGVGEVSIQVQY